MDTKAKQEFRDKWRADLDAYYAERRRQLDLEYQRDLKRIDEIWTHDTSGEESSPALPVASEAPTPLEKSQPETNGSPSGLTRREMLLEILPEYRGRTFTQPDIQRSFLEKYPKAYSPHLQPGLSTLLRQMAEKGEKIERVKKAKRPTEAHVYRVKDDGQEENLLEP